MGQIQAPRHAVRTGAIPAAPLAWRPTARARVRCYRPPMPDEPTIEGRERELTQASAEAQQRRAELHETLIRLERTISSPARGRLADWAGDVAKALANLPAAVDAHVTAPERPGAG